MFTSEVHRALKGAKIVNEKAASQSTSLWGLTINSLRKTVLVEETDPSLQHIYSEPVLFSDQLFLAAAAEALYSQNGLSSYATGLQQIWELGLA